MAGLSRKLFVNWWTKKLQLSDESATPVDPPIFQKYETVPLQVVIVEPCSPWGPNNFVRVDITGISLTVAINDTLDDATPLASQSTFTKVTATNTFTGELSLNTAGMNSYIGSNSEKAAYLEIECIEGASARPKIYTNAITLRGSLLQVATTSPDTNQEYLTRQQMEGIFVPFRLKPGQTISIPSAGSVYERILGANDDGSEQDDMLPL